MTKLFANAVAALDGLLTNGMSLASGGFGLCGIPESLIAAVELSAVRDVTVFSNDGGTDDFGLGPMLASGRCSKLVASYIGSNPQLAQRFVRGEIDIDLVPQGTLAERMRAGGAGIPGFYTATGVGTVIAEGKEHQAFDGRIYILERGIVTDLSIVKAWKADSAGNLVFRKTARNFNVPVATCGRVCVAEVEEMVPLGSLDPDTIHLPGIYVHRIVTGKHEKRIEQRTFRKRETD